jgi:hypothetical protein
MASSQHHRSGEVRVIFGERWGNKSYKVTIEPMINYNSERIPHVETHEEGLQGKSFRLGRRFTQSKAVMYEVEGVTNNYSR